MIPFASKLPDVGTTIFTVMSRMAAEYGAVNLGQGFPDFDGDPALMRSVAQAMENGHNQYPPMAGVMSLRERIAEKTSSLYGFAYDAEQEITITAGATQALFTAIQAVVHPGDEVIVLLPCYDSYIPAIKLAGGRPVLVHLADDFSVDINAIAKAVSPRTRLIIINTPHNPSGRVWRMEDWARLAKVLMPTNVLVLSDEVYEHMVYDGQRHASAVSEPIIRERAMVVSSFGKTFHVTGWKVGYLLAPAELTLEFRKVHQFNVFTVNTPMQVGLAEYLRHPEPYLNLSSFYQPRRDLLSKGLQSSGFKVLPTEGTYFLLAEINARDDLPNNDKDACEYLTKTLKVAAIPLSAFYLSSTSSPTHLIRFCFAKKIETITLALTRLAR